MSEQDDGRMSARKTLKLAATAAVVAAAALAAAAVASASRPTAAPSGKPAQTQTNPSQGAKSHGAQATDSPEREAHSSSE